MDGWMDGWIDAVGWAGCMEVAVAAGARPCLRERAMRVSSARVRRSARLEIMHSCKCLAASRWFLLSPASVSVHVVKGKYSTPAECWCELGNISDVSQDESACE